jgi:hypothetical protein
MSWWRLVSSIGLILLTNAVVFAGVAYNRSGPPQGVMTLTERELPVAYDAFRNSENTDLSLHIQWQQPNPRPVLGSLANQRRVGEWFDQAKLKAVGFHCAVSVTDPSAAQYYDKMLPREAFVVLEYGGQGWKNWLAEWERDIAFIAQQVTAGTRSMKDLSRLKEAYAEAQRSQSRLVVIDVGTDPVQLRGQYPDTTQFLIALAQIRMYLVRPDSQRPTEPYLRGKVTQLLVDDLHVPLELRRVLDALPRPAGGVRAIRLPLSEMQEPRYEVTLQSGKRYEPWVVAIRLLQTSASLSRSH